MRFHGRTHRLKYHQGETLLETMRLAEHRDDIAREYVTGFATTFECGAPALRSARADGLSWDDAVVESFLTLLAVAPDTHIIRRAGVLRLRNCFAKAATPFRMTFQKILCRINRIYKPLAASSFADACRVLAFAGLSSGKHTSSASRDGCATGRTGR